MWQHYFSQFSVASSVLRRLKWAASSVASKKSGTMEGQKRANAFTVVKPIAKTRQCDFVLSINDGCVFADFAKHEKTVKLLQISFDGHGCCDCANVNVMDEKDAKELLAWVNAASVSDQARCHSIIARYCTQNMGVIWQAALREYELLVHDN